MKPIDQVLAQAKALLKSVSFDDNGAMVAGHYVGGHGGMLSRDTIKAADALRLSIDLYEREPQETTE